MITQLDPPLPLETAKGAGLAHFVIDYGPEADLMWVVFMDSDGACWTVPNPEIRMSMNWSMGRRKPKSGKPAAAAVPAAAADGAIVHRVFPRADATGA
ncbi:MAG: hypothetical protein Q8M26_01755 [Pseudolabrys sp.]|nr:hypothetical protein [Pseudolabrys sp.]